MTISALIHTKNSQETIEQAITSVAWADEIVVVDMHSQDKTVEVCRKYTDKIYLVDDVGYVEPARNFGISKSAGEWVLIVDADEEIPETLATTLKELSTKEADAWELPRKNLIWGHWVKHAGWWPDYNVRFFRKGSVQWPEKIHEKPKVTGLIERLPAEEQYAIIHHNYKSVEEFVSRLNRYTTITASEGGKYNSSPMIAFWEEFQRRFFAQEGYKDNNLGLYLAILQGCYEAVFRIKLWEKENKKIFPVNVAAEIDNVMRQLAYWRADYMIRNTKGIRQFYWRLRRKLQR